MLEERLRLIPDKIQRFLEYMKWTPGDFASILDIEVTESYKLLSGEPANYFVAKKFIYFFQASLAKEFIDWDTMGVSLPRFKHTRKALEEDVLFSIMARNIKDLEKEKKLR